MGSVVTHNGPGSLKAFIREQLAEYVEPTRAGTQRGDPVGLSRQKFHATLLTMTALPLREAAKRSGVSYGLLRKWRTERLFRAQAESNTTKFYHAGFLPSVAVVIAKRRAHLDETLRGPIRSITRYQPPTLEDLTPNFADAAFYGAHLVRDLRARLTRDLYGPKASSDPWTDAAARGAFRKSLAPARAELYSEGLAVLESLFGGRERYDSYWKARSNLGDAELILAADDLSDDARRQALYLLHLAELAVAKLGRDIGVHDEVARGLRIDPRKRGIR
jgi:hypothetical protein